MEWKRHLCFCTLVWLVPNFDSCKPKCWTEAQAHVEWQGQNTLLMLQRERSALPSSWKCWWGCCWQHAERLMLLTVSHHKGSVGAQPCPSHWRHSSPANRAGGEVLEGFWSIWKAGKEHCRDMYEPEYICSLKIPQICRCTTMGFSLNAGILSLSAPSQTPLWQPTELFGITPYSIQSSSTSLNPLYSVSSLPHPPTDNRRPVPP